jgi:DNA invertase Pin-like site-specific DNA recombinase
VTTSVKSANRPGLRSVLDYLRRNDTFVILKLNRLDLPVKQLMGLLVMLERRGVAFQSLDDQVDPTTPEGQTIWRMLLELQH